MTEEKPKPWRVRVQRKVEDWVEVLATSPTQAEDLASQLPQVIFVYRPSALRGDKLAVTGAPAVGVEDETEDR